MKIIYFIIMQIFLSVSLLGQTDGNNALNGLYFGQEKPKNTPLPFASEIISKKYNSGVCSFSPDNKWCFFNHRTGRYSFDIYAMHCQDEGTWSSPTKVSFSNGFKDLEPIISPKGYLLFGSNRNNCTGKEIKNTVLFISKPLDNNSWSTPQLLLDTTLTKSLRPLYYVTQTTEGDLFFRGQNKKGDLFSSSIQSAYSVIDTLPFNTQYNESHPCIAKDGKYLLFDSDRPGGYGKSDIYITFRNPDGSWSQAINAGKHINNGAINIQPLLSPDEKYLFFLRIVEKERPQIYWVSTHFIDEIKKQKD